MLLTSALNAAGERPHNNMVLLGAMSAQTSDGGTQPLAASPAQITTAQSAGAAVGTVVDSAATGITNTASSTTGILQQALASGGQWLSAIEQATLANLGVVAMAVAAYFIWKNYRKGHR